jgi:hypothetical protein
MNNAIKLAALYQWVWNIDGGFNWYAGVGGGLGSLSITLTTTHVTMIPLLCSWNIY